MNDSSTGGYLAPTVDLPPPLEGQALNRFLQGFVVGVTGLPGNMVRPRWQAEPPDQPDFGIDWCAIGVTRRAGDTYAVEQHEPAGAEGLGLDYVMRGEELEILASFYGPDADSYAEIFREGVQVEQNCDALEGAGFAMVDVGEALAVPDLTKQRWVYRADVNFRVRRYVTRSYPVRTIVSAAGTIYTDAADPNFPAFGFDQETAYVSGWDVGKWVQDASVPFTVHNP